MPSLHLPICPPPSQFVASTDLCTGCIVLPFLEHQPVGIMQYGAFSGWPLSFGNTRLNILWVYSWPVSTSLFIAQWHATVWMDHSLFTPTEGHLGHFQVLANKNKVVINICMPVCVGISSSHLDKYQGVWLLDGTVCLVLLETTSLPGEGNGTPLQYSCLENPMDRGAW